MQTHADAGEDVVTASTSAPASPNHQSAHLAQRIGDAVTRGVSWLESAQLPDGEFQTEFCVDRTVGEDGQTRETLVFDSSPFVTTLVIHSLGYAQLRDARVAGMTRKAVGFLRAEMDPGGLWRYWTRKNDKRAMIPPDLDDTACASQLLTSHGVSIPNNHRLFYDSRDARGAFYTWLYKPNSLAKWMLWARTRGRAFSYTNQIWQWTGKDDVCAVVNASVLFYLGETPQTRPAIQYLLRTISEGREAQEIVFYAHPLSLYYMLTRAFAHGVSALQPARAAILDRIASLRQPDGSYGDELLTAMAIDSIYNLGEVPAPESLESLLRTQRPDGSWRRIPMYGGPPVPTTFGSADLTSALCLEALARS